MVNDTESWCVWEASFEHLAITSSQSYIHKEMAPARTRGEIKAVEGQVDLLEDVFTPPWKQ